MSTTRQRIVSATTDLFRQRGYNGTSLKMITTASEATTGSLYHFFPGGKDQLTADVVESSGAAYLQLFEMFVDGAPNLIDAFVEFFDGGALLLEETGFIDPCPIGGIAREVASVNEPLRIATQRVFRSWVESATLRFEHAGIATIEASDLAIAIVAIIEGGFVLSRTAKSAEPFRACARQVDLLVRAHLGAIRSRH
ncbi:MAG: transcriptional regulator, TetR family [Acidimicrobiales bacterium]|nr:transcriptional regulator, TetR family [Acidimicrobiales bacterium]